MKRIKYTIHEKPEKGYYPLLKEEKITDNLLKYLADSGEEIVQVFKHFKMFLTNNVIGMQGLFSYSTDLYKFIEITEVESLEYDPETHIGVVINKSLLTEDVLRNWGRYPSLIEGDITQAMRIANK